VNTHKPTIEFHGPTATHDMACAVCQSRPAVYSIPEGVFKPCWICQEAWELRRIPWWVWIFRRTSL